MNSADLISYCNTGDSAKSDTQYSEVENSRIFGCNSIQQGSIDERHRGDNVFMNDFRSTEQLLTDNRDSTSGTMPGNLSRNSSTSSLDSSYIDVLNDLSCEELDFFLGLYAPLIES
jgi:hypothetical protein